VGSGGNSPEEKRARERTHGRSHEGKEGEPTKEDKSRDFLEGRAENDVSERATTKKVRQEGRPRQERCLVRKRVHDDAAKENHTENRLRLSRVKIEEKNRNEKRRTSEEVLTRSRKIMNVNRGRGVDAESKKKKTTFRRKAKNLIERTKRSQSDGGKKSLR